MDAGDHPPPPLSRRTRSATALELSPTCLPMKTWLARPFATKILRISRSRYRRRLCSQQTLIRQVPTRVQDLCGIPPIACLYRAGAVRNKRGTTAVASRGAPRRLRSITRAAPDSGGRPGCPLVCRMSSASRSRLRTAGRFRGSARPQRMGRERPTGWTTPHDPGWAILRAMSPGRLRRRGRPVRPGGVRLRVLRGGGRASLAEAGRRRHDAGLGAGLLEGGDDAVVVGGGELTREQEQFRSRGWRAGSVLPASRWRWLISRTCGSMRSGSLRTPLIGSGCSATPTSSSPAIRAGNLGAEDLAGDDGHVRGVVFDGRQDRAERLEARRRGVAEPHRSRDALAREAGRSAAARARRAPAAPPRVAPGPRW